MKIRELLEGREENLRAWFGNSKVVDTNGLPMIVYHGTKDTFDLDDGGFDTFEKQHKDFGMHFGTREAANEFGQGIGGRVIPVYLKITNPLTMPDIFAGSPEDVQELIDYFFQKKIIDQNKYNELTEHCSDAFNNYSKWPDTRAELFYELESLLLKAGYDGIQYRNTHEGMRTLRPDERINLVIKKEGLKYAAYLPNNIMPTAPLGVGKTPEKAEQNAYKYLQQQASAIDMSYIIFNSSQVKSAFGTEYDPSDPRYTKENKRNPKYLSGTDKVANISPVLGAKPKKQKALMNKFFGSS